MFIDLEWNKAEKNNGEKGVKSIGKSAWECLGT